MDREPAVAGMFYPDDPAELRGAVMEYIGSREPSPALGVMSPHAGYIYSGRIAGSVFSAVEVPDLCVILAPNHTGMAKSEFSVWPDGNWKTPLGDVSVDESMCAGLIRKCRGCEADLSAHLREHSAEVQLPFIQTVNPSARIVPVVISTQDVSALKELGSCLADVINEGEEEVLVVASSDMTHYESQESAEKKDRLALDRVEALDAEGLIETVLANRVSMCGVAPTAVMIDCTVQLGASSTRCTGYQTSGDVTGDLSQVVGYAGAVVA